MQTKNDEERNESDRNIEVFKVLVQQAEGVIKNLQDDKVILEEDISNKKR